MNETGKGWPHWEEDIDAANIHTILLIQTAKDNNTNPTSQQQTKHPDLTFYQK